MTISYNWLCNYLPEKLSAEKLSAILTSIGLEVESLTVYEEIKGGLKGLIVGEILQCSKHPDADKLNLTVVNIGEALPLNIVCGASNVAVGQKVIVAPIGTTLYPINGEAIAIKKAKIRGIESQGMICAEDEIGLSNDHAGIKILPAETPIGTNVTDLFTPYEDIIFEIGLTPNRMDAMSHLGVAKDICAYLSFHNQKVVQPVSPFSEHFVSDANNQSASIKVSIENELACKRYSGISLNNIQVTDSPHWLKQKLKSIGLNPINNIVDITNFILHETGQPLHAFDADKIIGNEIIVKNIEAESNFITLDGKERKIKATDLMICNAAEPMCIAGVYGGLQSGVTKETTNIFLESACFDGSTVRKTSLSHSLRTDAATRFEKGIDISNTVNVVKRAALLIKEIAGGTISSELIDLFPNPPQKTTVLLTSKYLKKLSGKEYLQADIKKILIGLGFEIINESNEFLECAVPFSKPDISIPADIVEEIMRIDGLDQIEIPTTIRIAPSIEKEKRKNALREKNAQYLVGAGFYEIFTNSITNSNFYEKSVLDSSVKMMNSLSADLDMLRPQMIQSGLQVMAHNFNRKNLHLRFFEFGKTYSRSEEKGYKEKNHLCIYITGQLEQSHWKNKASKADYFYLKGIIENIFTLSGINNLHFEPINADAQISTGASIWVDKTRLGEMGEVAASLLKQFDIKYPVFYADIDWDGLISQGKKFTQFKEISRFPTVNRDLAMVVDKNVSYSQIEQIALSRKVAQLTSVELFDIFESEKLGADKKSMAMSFTFMDENKTLTDQEIDAFMKKIVAGFESGLQAEIRK